MKVQIRFTRQETVSMQAPLTYRVAIVGFEKRLDHHTWFTLMITSGQPGLPSKHYQIARTFRQFVQFSQKLRDSQPHQPIPHLKLAKQFLNLNFMTPQQKHEELERYLAQFSRFPIELVSSIISRNFFGIHEPDLSLNNKRMSTNVPFNFPPLLIRTISDSSFSSNSQDSIDLYSSSGLEIRQLSDSPLKSKSTANIIPITTSTSSSSTGTTRTGTNMKRSKSLSRSLSRSLSVRPLLNSAKSALSHPRGTILPHSRSTSNITLEDHPPTAPWNRPDPPSDDDQTFSSSDDIKLPTGVIAPWNIKNLDSKDQASLDLLKPVLAKRRSRIQLGERANRMKDFENCMDTVLPVDTVKFKVVLNQDQIILLRVSRTIPYSALILKIRAKFLRNSNSCAPQLKNKLLVYKLSSSKIYQLTNEEEFLELMALKPASVTLCWININLKFISR